MQIRALIRTAAKHTKTHFAGHSPKPREEAQISYNTTPLYPEQITKYTQMDLDTQ